jgi:hypothetical protein
MDGFALPTLLTIFVVALTIAWRTRGRWRV